jgi:hypothetical protein
MSNKFTQEIANNYFKRNPKFKTKQTIIVLSNFLKNEVLENVFEVGCHTGAQLHYLTMGSNTKGYGIDLSGDAIAEGSNHYKNLNLKVGRCPDDFDKIIEDNSMDLIHFWFCFYLMSDIEVEDSLSIALRKLKKGKFLSIEDFDAISVSEFQRDNVTIYKRDYSNIDGLKLLEKRVFYDNRGYNNVSYDNEKDRYSIWLFKKNI